MKILYVSAGYTTHDFRFLQVFRSVDWEVGHLQLTTTSTDSRSLPDGVQSIAWERSVRELKPSDCPQLLSSFQRLLEAQRPSVILAGPVPTAAYLVALSEWRRFVAMSWGSDILVDAQEDSSKRAAAIFTLERAGGVFGDCSAVASSVQELAPVASNRMVTFPWGIDLHRFSPGRTTSNLRVRLGWQDKRVLLCTRSWERGYGIEILLHAVAAIVPEHPDVRLLLVGNGSLQNEIFSLIDRLHLRHIVHAPGRIDYEALPDFFRMSDFYVSAARSDGTSVSLLEAMACGLPAIVTEGYGNLEWVSPGVHGWLAKPDDSPSLAAALHQALVAPSPQITTMKKNNIAVVRARADWPKNIPRLLLLLEEVSRDKAQ